jgi:peptidoglycan/xylan/chitin deacetylase (PgdA/CDA1 family)
MLLNGYPVRTPALAKLVWKNRTFHLERQQPNLFLTFDDGPTPGVTDWVLDVLAAYDARATFFMVGNNVRKNPALARRVVQQGHTVGNHTYHHLNGWKTPVREYLSEIARTDAVIHEVTGVQPRLFRPPYGKCHPGAWKHILENHEIVLWDVLPGDWDSRVTIAQLHRRVATNARAGSIVVLHDSLKCATKLKATLPGLLQHFSEEGLSFKAL